MSVEFFEVSKRPEVERSKYGATKVERFRLASSNERPKVERRV